jgi:hypothetical protein
MKSHPKHRRDNPTITRPTRKGRDQHHRQTATDQPKTEKTRVE